ncbi:MAG: flagellar hook-associated protein FlgK [Paracoccaceae bacterium]
MTISGALSNALSGLRATSRASDIIAMNVSNATTPGYARRELTMSATSGNLVGGVTVDGVIRINNPAVTSARRDAQADYGHSDAISSFHVNLERLIGTPDQPGGLTNTLAEFESSLLIASSRPDSPERLSATLQSAKNMVDVINNASKNVTNLRGHADANIDAMVIRLNSALEEVESLNIQIAEFNISNLDTSSLQDLRQQVVDEIHELAPVRIAQREHGQIALYSTGGVVLIDGSAREIDFSASNQVTPYMSLDGGQLSGLSVDGAVIRTGSSNGDLPGGKIAAEFAIRDELATNALTEIDAAARDLVERFQDPAVDATLAVGDAGLFTDSGLSFDPLDEIGLAERLQINAAVDPAQGGEEWRLRDGINATVPGAVGQSSLLDAMRSALNNGRVPASGNFGTGNLSAGDIANSMISQIGVQRLNAEQSLSFAATTFHEVSQAERALGVDTDTELQRLMVVQQAYAANARVFTTIEEMMDTLMRLGA